MMARRLTVISAAVKKPVIASPARARQSSPGLAKGAGAASKAAWIATGLTALAMTQKDHPASS